MTLTPTLPTPCSLLSHLVFTLRFHRNDCNDLSKNRWVFTSSIYCYSCYRVFFCLVIYLPPIFCLGFVSLVIRVSVLSAHFRFLVSCLSLSRIVHSTSRPIVLASCIELSHFFQVAQITTTLACYAMLYHVDVFQTIHALHTY